MRNWDDKDFRKGAAVGCAVGAAVGWLISSFTGWIEAWQNGHFWTVLTAFGTLGAVVVALIVANIAGNARDKELRDVSAVALELARPSLESAAFTLAAMDAGLKMLISQAGHPIQHQMAINSLKRHAESLRLEISMNQLVHLARGVGANGTATAKAMGEVQLIKRECADIYDVDPDYADHIDLFALIARRRVATTGQLLVSVIGSSPELATFDLAIPTEHRARIQTKNNFEFDISQL